MQGQGRVINHNGSGQGQVNNWSNEGGFTVEERKMYAYLVNPDPITSPAETEAFVRETMRGIVYRRAFKLKEFISGDVRRTAEILKASLGLAHKYKLLLQNGKALEPGWSASAERARIIENLNSSLLFAVAYEKRLAALKELWQFFRTNYKVEMRNMINKIVQNESQPKCEESISWKILLPEMPGDAQDAFENGYVPS